ncbi:MAG TPA: hypothetical protein VNF69_08110, partial [Burkholderiales bacterium]|nr:hypothetical protein [Burkholderiales bacterium]
MPKPNLYDPTSPTPFPLSRSKVELFLDCPRCLYLDRRLGISRPSGPPFNLNSAVDALLKTEFDHYREEGAPHPLMTEAGIRAVPHPHPQLATWRANFKGVRTLHEATNFELFGAIDHLWRDLDTGEMIVVDYKSTSKSREVSIETGWVGVYGITIGTCSGFTHVAACVLAQPPFRGLLSRGFETTVAENRDVA